HRRIRNRPASVTPALAARPSNLVRSFFVPATARWVGVDFGTTNSAVAIADASGAARLARFPNAEGGGPTFPSVLYFEPNHPSVSGSEAIERYLESETKGRF